MNICECGTPIQPFRGGYPGGLLIPWHNEPNGAACRLAQGPFRGSVWQESPPQAVAAPTGSGPVGLLYKGSGRRFLTLPGPDANIHYWFDLVEKQTGEPFQIDGDAHVVAEELGETLEAIARGDQAQVEDGLCDTYVTAVVAEILLRRGDLALQGYKPVLQPWDSLSGPNICAIFSGRLGSYVRKPKTTARAQWVLDSLLTAKAAVQRDIKELGVEWPVAIGKVLDILDGRLVTGYKMSAKGSAIKAADL